LKNKNSLWKTFLLFVWNINIKINTKAHFKP